MTGSVDPMKVLRDAYGAGWTIWRPAQRTPDRPPTPGREQTGASWCATRIDPSAGVDPTVIRESWTALFDELRRQEAMARDR